MILGFIEILNLAAVETRLLGMPESFGLLVFGIGLTGTAVLMRRLLGRYDEDKTHEKLEGKV